MSHRLNLVTHATSNYIAGRLAARAALVPVCGNLIHHALEMYLKAGLLHRLSLDQMRARDFGFGHDLARLWLEYKSGDPALDRFDQVIVDVHAWESIRYPELIAERGRATFLVSWQERRTPGLRRHPAIQGTQVFEIVMNRIDELVIALMDGLGVDPREWRPLEPSALDAVLHENPCSPRWMPPSWLISDDTGYF